MVYPRTKMSEILEIVNIGNKKMAVAIKWLPIFSMYSNEYSEHNGNLEQ